MRASDQWLPGAQGGKAAAKDHEGTIWGDANILNLNGDDGKMGIDICQNSLNYIQDRKSVV